MTTTLYRVTNPETRIGLWYAEDGTKTDFILSLDDAQSATMPMDYDPEFVGGWTSACDNLPGLSRWFSHSDIVQLNDLGYGLFAFEVTEYKTANGHALFLKKDVVTAERLHFNAMGVEIG